eukprot:300571-Chlamydomonas_euryale.AAC.1
MVIVSPVQGWMDSKEGEDCNARRIVSGQVGREDRGRCLAAKGEKGQGILATVLSCPRRSAMV